MSLISEPNNTPEEDKHIHIPYEMIALLSLENKIKLRDLLDNLIMRERMANTFESSIRSLTNSLYPVKDNLNCSKPNEILDAMEKFYEENKDVIESNLYTDPCARTLHMQHRDLVEVHDDGCDNKFLERIQSTEYLDSLNVNGYLTEEERNTLRTRCRETSSKLIDKSDNEGVER